MKGQAKAIFILFVHPLLKKSVNCLQEEQNRAVERECHRIKETYASTLASPNVETLSKLLAEHHLLHVEMEMIMPTL